MKTRSKSYLGTFKTTPEGLKEYEEFKKTHWKPEGKGYCLMKMFRGNKRKTMSGVWFGSRVNYHAGTSPKLGATHFDVYIRQR